MRSLALIAVCGMLGLIPGLPPQGVTSVIASENNIRLWADVNQNDEVWTVVPHLEATPRATSGHYDYVISSHKVGQSGRSDTRQSGQVRIGTGEQAMLGNLRIAIRKGDSCIVRVSVYSELELVGKLTLDLPQPPH